METRQGKIEEKNLKFAANKAPYATFTIGGLKYNSFDKEIVDNHNPDDFVEFTGEQEGKFWALKTMNKIPEPAPGTTTSTPPTGNGAKEYHLSPEEVKCRALTSAIEYCSETADIRHLLEVADEFVEWIYNGKN